jgi:hypothetical protein
MLKPPVKIDHLVTFNFLPNRYQAGVYQNFRELSGPVFDPVRMAASASDLSASDLAYAALR